MVRFRLFKLLMLAVLCLPVIFSFCGIGENKDNTENRVLVDSVDLRAKDIVEWPESVEQFWNDSAPYRSFFVRTYIDFWCQYLYSMAGSDIRGRNHYFYQNSYVLENYLGLHPLSVRQLRDKKYVLASHQAYCILKGVSYVAFFIPDKTTCYPEYLPFYTEWKRGRSWAEVMVPYLAKSPINIIDLTPYLLKKKTESRIYNYHGDTQHWNGNGLDVAYHVMRETLTLMRPDLIGRRDSLPYKIRNGAPDVGNDFLQIMQTTNNHNYSLIKDFLPQWKTVQRFSWGAPDLIVNKCKEKGNLLQVSDSYFKACAQVKFEGAHGNIFPIADDVHRYLHCHYADITTSALDIVSTQFQPDFMVESFVERTCNQWSTNDPYLLTIADLFLQTGYALVIDPHEIPLAKLPVHQASWSEGDGGLVFHSQGSQSYINSDTPPRCFLSHNCQ
jgi:hypothetical protein